MGLSSIVDELRDLQPGLTRQEGGVPALYDENNEVRESKTRRKVLVKRFSYIADKDGGTVKVYVDRDREPDVVDAASAGSEILTDFRSNLVRFVVFGVDVDYVFEETVGTKYSPGAARAESLATNCLEIVPECCRVRVSAGKRIVVSLVQRELGSKWAVPPPRELTSMECAEGPPLGKARTLEREPESGRRRQNDPVQLEVDEEDRKILEEFAQEQTFREAPSNAMTSKDSQLQAKPTSSWPFTPLYEGLAEPGRSMQFRERDETALQGSQKKLGGLSYYHAHRSGQWEGDANADGGTPQLLEKGNELAQTIHRGHEQIHNYSWSQDKLYVQIRIDAQLEPAVVSAVAAATGNDELMIRAISLECSLRAMRLTVRTETADHVLYLENLGGEIHHDECTYRVRGLKHLTVNLKKVDDCIHWTHLHY